MVRLFCPPEALQAEIQGVASRLIWLAVHHRLHHLRVLHDHRHLAVPLSQHAAIVDVGRACRPHTAGRVSVPAGSRGRQSAKETTKEGLWKSLII